MIIVCGTTRCGDHHRAKPPLKERGAPYMWIDIEHEASAAEEMLRLSGGTLSASLLHFPDGSNLVEPPNVELAAKLDGRSA